MSNPLLHWDAVPLAVGALLALTAGSRRSAGRVMAGLVVIALAFAGVRVATAEGSPFSELARSFQIVTLALLAIGALLVWRSRPVLADGPATARPAGDIDAPALILHLAAAAIAGVAGHLHLFMPAVLLSAASGWFWSRPRRWPVVIAPALLLMAACWYLMARVAGPMPLSLALLHEAPFSAAFEVGMAGALLVVAAALLGLAPFHMMGRGPLTPILGALLLARVVAPGLPGGLEHWQPVAYPVVLLTAAVAALSRRDDLALLALGGLGLLSGDSTAGWSGLVLLVLAVVVRALDWLAAGRRRMSGAGQALVGLVGLSAAVVVVPVLVGGLEAETLYTAGTALLAAVAFARVHGLRSAR